MESKLLEALTRATGLLKSIANNTYSEIDLMSEIRESVTSYEQIIEEATKEQK